MKKIFALAGLFTSILMMHTVVFGAVGSTIAELGPFGGISEGVALPKTTEKMLADTSNKKKETTTDLRYKEIIFISGKPVEFEGMLQIRPRGSVSATSDMGSYRETYWVRPADNAPEGAPELNRMVEFTVNYRKVTSSGSEQLILDYEVYSWNETLEVDGVTYNLDRSRSYLGRSIIQDITPGVTYYSGNMSQVAVYTSDSEGFTTVETSGNIYGYNSAWSKTETNRIDVTVDHADGWQLEAQIRPSVSVGKTLQYSPNEPTAISFDGNYYEVIRNQSALSYSIYTIPLQFERGVSRTGSFNISTINRFETLPAPDLAFLAGHFAEADIKKLFAMEVLEGEPKHYQPAQAMTRGQFIMALVKAIKLPIEEVSTGKNKKTVVTVLFPDVQSNRQDFPYIMAAYKAGLATGRYDTNFENYFRPDEAITREEAITIMIRALGLENLGLDPTPITPFTDDKSISAWAKREASAAYTLGIVLGDSNGKFNPQINVSKAEGAALINRMVDYMRQDLPTDYVEHILNFE